MLEYFMIEKLCGSKHEDEENPQENFYGGALVTDGVGGLIALAISCVAAYLAYHKNSHESPGMRVLITLVAFLFSQLYLVYYVVRYVLLKDGKRKSGKSGRGRGKSGRGRGKGRGRK